jgi:hypothetical protein
VKSRSIGMGSAPSPKGLTMPDDPVAHPDPPRDREPSAPTQEAAAGTPPLKGPGVAPDRDAARRTQEPWDHARFVEIYNRFAKERGGWFYEADGRTEDEMGARYRYYPEVYPDLKTFADGLFIWEQRLNL